MEQLMGSPILGAMAAMGYAFTKVLLVGLASSGPWIFLVIATVSLGYSALKPISDSEAPYAFFRHLLAVCVAAILLASYTHVDLSLVVGDRLATGVTGTVTDGAAPLPTYAIDVVGTALTSTAKSIVAKPTDYLIPMLSNVVREATANPANLVDKQVAANLSMWRFISAAAMRADSSVAQAIQSKGLLNRLQNPVAMNDIYSGKKAVAEMSQIVSILDSAKDVATLGVLVCGNSSQLKTLADEFTGISWIPDNACASPGGVTMSVVSSATTDVVAQAQSPGSFIDPNAASKAAKGASMMQKLISDNTAAASQTHFSTMSEVFRALGAGALLSSAVQSAQDDSFKVMLGEQCNQKGDAACLGSFAPTYNTLGNVVDNADHGQASSGGFSWSKITDSIWKIIAGSIAYIVGAFMSIFAKLVASLMPFAIAMARSIAIVISVLGIYLLLLPSRVGDSIKWMIGPIAWVHVWSVLYLFWWKFSEFILDYGEQLFWDASAFTGDGISSAAVIQFTAAVVYTALPVIAWAIVFGLPERLAPRGGVGNMISPVTQSARHLGISKILNAGRSKGSSGGGNESSGVSNSKGGGGGTGGAPSSVPSNPASGPHEAGSAAKSAGNAQGTAPHSNPAR